MAYESWFTGKSVDKGLWHHIHLTSASTAGVWVGTIGNPDPGDADEGVNTSSFALEEGVKILVRITVAPGASSTTLNLNGKGAKTVYYRWASSTDKVNLNSSQFAVGSVLPLVYCADAGGWVLANSAPKTTQSATPYMTASASGGTFSLNSHAHGVTDNKHTHTFTPAGTVSLGHSSETTGSSTTGVTATSSTPSFTGSAHSHTFTGTSHCHSVNDSSHSHAYDKATSASFSGSSGTTGGPSNNSGGISTASTATGSTEPSFDVTDPTVSITDKGHNHYFTPSGSISNNTSSTSVITGATFADMCLTFTIGTVAPVTHNHNFNGTRATTDSSATGVTAKATGTAVSGGNHSHTYDKTTGVTLSSHTHSYTPSGSVNLFYNYGNTQTAETAATDGRVYTVASTSGISVNAATAGGSIGSTTAGGSISTPTITVKDPGHTHSYSYTSGASFTGTGGTTSSNASNISINSTTVTAASITQPTITVSGGVHTHEVS